MKREKNIKLFKTFVLILTASSFLFYSCDMSSSNEDTSFEDIVSVEVISDFSDEQGISIQEESMVFSEDKDFSYDESVDSSKELSEELSEEMSEETSEETSDNSSDNISDETSEGVSDDITVTIDFAAERFADKFTSGEIISEENLYKSEFVSVTLSEVTYGGKVFFVQDIYIKQIESFYVGFAGLKYGSGKYNDYVLDMTRDYVDAGYNVVSAINGDYCALDGNGAVIRNGILYGKGIAEYTVCVLYKNGTMKTISKENFNAEEELAKGAWHVWDFGPSLLDDDGNAISEFTERTSIKGSNPRAVIGYYEPGHYCFVVVGGRGGESPCGVSFNGISNFMNSLGCKLAYNLDGGKSAVMVFNDKVTNEKYQGTGRKITDIVFIQDFTSTN